MSKVHVTVVDNEGGLCVLKVSSDPAVAKKALADYCREWWEQEHVGVGSDIDDPDSAPDDDVISEYFNSERVQYKGERGIIEEMTLED